jgi:hypothetical protein
MIHHTVFSSIENAYVFFCHPFLSFLYKYTNNCMFKIWYMTIIFSSLLFSAAQMIQGFVCETCCRRVIIILFTQVSSRKERRKPCGCTFKHRQKNIGFRLSVVRLYQHIHAFLPYCFHHPQPHALLENKNNLWGLGTE